MSRIINPQYTGIIGNTEAFKKLTTCEGIYTKKVNTNIYVATETKEKLAQRQHLIFPLTTNTTTLISLVSN